MRRRFLQLPRPSRSRTGRVSDAVYRRPGGLALMPLLLQSELRLHHHLLVHHVQSIFPMRTQTRECGGSRGCPLLTKLPLLQSFPILIPVATDWGGGSHRELGFDLSVCHRADGRSRSHAHRRRCGPTLMFLLHGPGSMNYRLSHFTPLDQRILVLLGSMLFVPVL